MSHINSRLERLRLYHKPSRTALVVLVTVMILVLRLYHKPSRTLLLLVGESPPPRKGFFYDADSPEGQLSRNTRKVFEDLSGVEFADRRDFLNHFKRKGRYLFDLFKPRGKTIYTADRREKEVAVEELSNLLRQEKPQITVSVLKRTSKLVEKAIERAQIPVSYSALPYPTRNYATQYRSELATILTSFSEAPSRAHPQQPQQ